MPVSGLFHFYRRPSPLQVSRASHRPYRKSGKGETTVSDKNETTKVAAKAAGLGISLDAWAVALALGLALLVWLGWIKNVPW
jgi:hypothetical protein